MRKSIVTFLALCFGVPAPAADVGGVTLGDTPAQADLKKAMPGG
jgi:hypothetical protein